MLQDVFDIRYSVAHVSFASCRSEHGEDGLESERSGFFAVLPFSLFFLVSLSLSLSREGACSL